MASPLERAIDSLSDPDVAVPDALRRLLVVTRRIDAAAATSWIKSELEGYPVGADLPEQRQGHRLPVAVRFDGGFGVTHTRHMYLHELPTELRIVGPGFGVHAPVAELHALAIDTTKAEPQMELPLAWLLLYRQLADEARVPSMSMCIPNHAAAVVPRTHLVGMLDTVKTVALDLALGIEDAAPDAGAAGGPTVVTDTALSDAVTSQMTVIFAANSSISVASGAGSTAVQVQVGDVGGLLRAARTFLSEEGVTGLAAAVADDGGEPGEATRTFLNRVRTGAVGLAAGVVGNGAYDGLVALLGQVFPGFS